MNMSTSREGLLLPQPTEKPIDADLHDSFMAAHLDNTETYKQLSVTGERKDEVLAAMARGENVDLSVKSEADAVSIEDRISALKAWKQELITDESIDPEIKQAYRWKVNEDIANLFIVQASRDGAMNAFHRWNEFVYGKPDETIYRAALDWIAKDAETLATSDKPAVAEAASEVLTMLEGQRGYRELLHPSNETFDAVKNDHMREGGYYALLLAGVDLPQKGKITNETGDPMLWHILRHNLQSDYDIVDSASGDWSVVHSKGQVERPKAFNLDVRRFQGLGVGHEMGRHLLEKVNGLRGPVRLASTGLDRTEWGNEGRAVVSEIVPYDTFDEFGKLVRWRDILRRDIAIGYASGIGSDSPRRSSETFAFVNTIDRMYQSKLTPDNSDETKTKADRKTGILLARILRGVDGSQGGAYLKDKVYLEGHVATWLTAAEKGADAISEGDLGKFDINNPRHIALLQRKGLLPDNQ